ncbi:MAG: hypothetical protein GY869_06190, partial [Planctomycetes bacterium]|nr:hypothetical protein [Planctomycetota bacterium]
MGRQTQENGGGDEAVAGESDTENDEGFNFDGIEGGASVFVESGHQ